MLDSKLNDRQKKYNEKINPNFQQETLLRRREEANLTLRKNKLFDTIMGKRLKILNERKKEETSELEINPSALSIPNILRLNFEKQENKLLIISKLITDEDFTEVKSNADTIEDDSIKFGICHLRRYLSDKKDKLSNSHTETILNVVYPVLERIFLSNFNESNSGNFNQSLIAQLQLKYEISWIFINLSSDCTDFVAKLLNISVLKRMEDLLEECLRFKHKYQINTSPLICHIFWIFSNIIGENRDSDIIVRNTVNLPDKLAFFCSYDMVKDFQTNDDTLSVLREVLFTTQSFIRDTEKVAKEIYKDILINVINIMKMASCEESFNFQIFSEGLTILKLFSECEKLIEAFLENQTVPLLINGLRLNAQAKTDDVYQNIVNTMKVFMHLLVGSDEQINFILSYPLLDKYLEMLTSINERTTSMQVENNFYNCDSSVVKEICMGISNICSSTQDNVDQIIKNSLFTDLLFSLYDKFGLQIKYEILFIFSNAFYVGSNYIKAEIVRMDVLRLFTNLLNTVADSKIHSVPIIVMILRTLNNFLLWGEKSNSKMNVIKCEIESDSILSIIDKLQFSNNSEVYDIAGHIYRNFWGEDEFLYSDPSDLLK